MKKLLILFSIFIVLFSGTLPVRAVSFDYAIGDAQFVDKTDSEGKLYGTWLKAEDKTSYSVSLYKGTTRITTKRVTTNSIDFSSMVNGWRGGAGKYTFTVYPTKGGDGLMIQSEEFEVTSAMASAIKNKINADYKAKIAAMGGGWMRGPGDIWIYYDKEGNQLKSQWLELDGFKYYLDKNGIMLTGWQIINQAYYYLEPKGSNGYPMGACWVNATTPDGKQVNEDGARLVEEGVVQKAVENKMLSSVVISLKEEQIPGDYTRITAITCGSGKVDNIVFASDQSAWTDSTTGIVTFDVTLTNGYMLKANTKVTCSRGTVTVTSRALTSFSAELHYTPKYVLKAPENLYISSEYVLRWDKVARAKSYTVKVTTAAETEEGNTKTTTSSKTVETNAVELFSMDVTPDTDVRSITVSASGNDTKTSVASAAAKIEDFPAFVASRTINGVFTTNKIGLKYTDEYGESAVGWKEIGGAWYHFKNTGYANKGWFQDTDSNWYYFDENGKMLTGDVTIDGKTYRLNPVEGGTPPLGAWIQ